MAATALAFFALICTSLVHAQTDTECITEFYGEPVGEEIPWPVPPPPLTEDWAIKIPQMCPDDSGRIVIGIEATVCFPDQTPPPFVTVNVLPNEVIIYSIDAQWSPITVGIILYCDYEF